MLTQRLLKSPARSAPAQLLATELSLLTAHPSLRLLLPFSKKLPQLAAQYTASPAGKSNASVWLARLEVEKTANGEQLKKVGKEARAVVQGDGVVDVWLWGIGFENVQDEESAQETLKELEVMSPRKRSRCTYLSPDFL